MRWFAKFAARADAVGAVLRFGLFVGALVSGMGIKSFAFLGAGIWWLLLGRF